MPKQSQIYHLIFFCFQRQVPLELSAVIC